MEPVSIAMLVMTVAAVVVLMVAAVVLWKGRPFAPGAVFRASRLSGGNRLFPTQVLITPTSIVHFTPKWVGRHEQSIHMAHVASVRIDTHLLFSDLSIETSGGTQAVVCRGHKKNDARRMKQLIEEHQSAYYRGGGQPPSQGPAVA